MTTTSDFDYTELLIDHGIDFLLEEQEEDVPVPMEDAFDDILSDKKPFEIALMIHNGRRYGFQRDGFNPNDEWFTFDGYGNLVSIPYLEIYLDETIDDEEFISWCEEKGYIDSVDDDDE